MLTWHGADHFRNDVPSSGHLFGLMHNAATSAPAAAEIHRNRDSWRVHVADLRCMAPTAGVTPEVNEFDATQVHGLASQWV